MTPVLAVAVRPHPDAEILVEFVGRSERRQQFDRRVPVVAPGLLPHLDRRAGAAFVGDHRVAGVGLVLDQHFPVAAVHVAQRRPFQDQPALGRAVDHVVDGREAVAEEALEVRPAVVQLDEDEVAVDPEIPHRRQAADQRHVLEAGAVVALAQRDREQRAVGAERPAVIGAAEHLAGVAARLAGDARALVRAAVVVDVDLAVGMARDQDRLAADLAGDEVARLRRLAGMAGIDPGVGEQVFHLELEHLVVDIDVAVDLARADQRADGVGDRCGSENRAPAWPAAPFVLRWRPFEGRAGVYRARRPDAKAVS